MVKRSVVPEKCILDFTNRMLRGLLYYAGLSVGYQLIYNDNPSHMYVHVAYTGNRKHYNNNCFKKTTYKFDEMEYLK